MVFLLAAFCCLLWGSAYPSVKIGYIQFGIASTDLPVQLVFASYRMTSAGILLIFFALISGRPLFKPQGGDLLRIIALGFVLTTVQYVFFYVGIGHTTGVKASILNAMTTFFSVLIAHFLHRNDRLSLKKILACCLGFLGVFIINYDKGNIGSGFSLLGEGFIMLASLSFAVGSIYSRSLSQRMDPLVLTAYQLTIGGLLLFVIGHSMGGEITHFSLAGTTLLAYTVFIAATGFALWTQLLKHNRVSEVSVFIFLNPIFGALLSAGFLGESIFELKNLLALILVCTGIWIVNREPAIPLQNEFKAH